MKIIVGNWKMNGSISDRDKMITKLNNIKTKNKLILCLPFTLLCKPTGQTLISSQDVSEHDKGAFTGEVSAKMVANTGAKYTIVGHSERRMYHCETNSTIKNKAIMAIQNKLIPIICIGETLQERKSGKTAQILVNMIKQCIPDKGNFIIAYEPRWAIGKGITPTYEDILSCHTLIFNTLQKLHHHNIPILYGASVTPNNAVDIVSIPHVDGLLIGGSSLKITTFLPIIKKIN